MKGWVTAWICTSIAQYKIEREKKKKIIVIV